VLKAIELTCERGGRALFQGLSFELGGGELLRLGGENGSGKTSLLRILCGLLSPNAGEVRWNDASIRSLREDYARALVYLGHAPAVKDDLSAAENLDIACRLAGNSVSEEQVFAALDRMGLARKDVAVRKLSQGQRRRAALARLVLSASVPLWFLDEPFSALDVAAAKVVADLIAAHVAGGGAVVYTTHQEVGITASRTIELGALA
jgi:heme exporter protein A